MNTFTSTSEDMVPELSRFWCSFKRSYSISILISAFVAGQASILGIRLVCYRLYKSLFFMAVKQPRKLKGWILTLQCHSRCTVRKYLYLLPVSVHRMVMKAFSGHYKFKTVPSWAGFGIHMSASLRG